MSIRSRIFLGIIVLFSVGFYLLIDFIVDDIELRYRESTEEPLVDASRVLATIASNSVEQGRIDTQLFQHSFKQVKNQLFEAQIFGLLKTEVDWHVYMTDRDGIIIFDSNENQDLGQDYSLWRDVYFTLRGEYGARTSPFEGDDDKRMLYIAAPIMREDDIIGVLSLGKPTHSSSQFQHAAQQKLILAGSMVCLVLIIIGLFLGAWVTYPIQRLTIYAKAVRDGKRIKRPALGSHEMEELGIAFEEMRDALNGKQYVENYVQSLTHEIKSPVSAIRGAVELLQEDLTPQQRSQFVHTIQQESERVRQIVDNLLLLSSLESQKYINTPDRFSINELLSELHETLLPLINLKQLDLQISATAPCHVQGDANLFRQALLNVLQNAIDFSPSQSEISITIKRLDTHVQISIRDHGPGIPDYAKDRIFERFYSLKRPGNGGKSSGLGLALVREIVTLHQGSVDLTSHSQGGTLVSITIPVTNG